MSSTRLFTDLIGLLANILSNLMPGQHIFRKEVHCQFSVYVYQSHCLFNNCSLFCNCCCDFLHYCTYYCKHYTVPTPRAIFFIYVANSDRTSHWEELYGFLDLEYPLLVFTTLPCPDDVSLFEQYLLAQHFFF